MRPRGGDGGYDVAFTEFVRTQSEALFRLAYLMSRDRSDAEDLLQTALLRTYRQLGMTL